MATDEQLEIYELSMLQCIEFEAITDQDPVDMFICLSGRGNFEGGFTAADSAKFKAQGRECEVSNINTLDTCQRMHVTVNLHNLYFKKTGKRVPIFFNGLKEQNEQLRKILARQAHYLGVQASHFIIDEIPLDNTVGQSIGLRVFVENNKHMFCEDGPKLVFVSDTYHIRRVVRTFGSDSPLFTSGFYLKERSILSKLSPEMRAQLLTDNPFIKKSTIYAYGKDRVMMSQLGAEADIKGDRNAVTNYSLHQAPPSISSVISDNVMQYRKALVWMSLRNAKVFEKIMSRTKDSTLTISLKPY